MRWITIDEHHVIANLNHMFFIEIDIDRSVSAPDYVRYYLETTDRSKHTLAREQYIESINDAKISAVTFIESFCMEQIRAVRDDRDRWIGQYYADHPDLSPKDE